MATKRKRGSPSTEEYEFDFVGEDDSRFFTERFGRRMNAMNNRYSLPTDEDEVKRSEFHHRVLNWVLGGRNYAGPVKELLDNSQRIKPNRILDMGTGGGIWAIDIADEFSEVEVIGVDLAPIQSRFEICDLDQRKLPYESEHFDVVHARSMHHGIKNYPQFLQEITRILVRPSRYHLLSTSITPRTQRPGGILLITEPETDPLLNGRLSSQLSDSDFEINARGWHELWKTYRRCLHAKGIDLSVPRRLRNLLKDTRAFRKVTTQLTDVPVGFWPEGKYDTQLSIGQLSWMEHDLLLPAMEPLLMDMSRKTKDEVKLLIQKAQHDLYYPKDRLSRRIHVVHAIKKIGEPQAIRMRGKIIKFNTPR
ncbi:hypothetical protein HWV62_3044 [Athelia sp. TMB]|nr:hypothetical protein HWV62_3044 [Athelia sp. TMB]